MKRLFPLLALLASIPFAHADENTSVARSSNAFGISLLKKVTPEEGKNTLVSPLSAFAAFSMLNSGATGETQNEIQKTLQVPGLSREALDQANSQLLRKLSQAKSVKLEIANSVWVREGFTLNPDYESGISVNYRGVIRTEDFASPQTIPTINGWISGKTHGKIKDALKSLNSDALAVLVNATYFKGSWLAKFDAEDKVTEFTNAKGIKVPASFMSRTSEYQYANVNGVQAIKLPYRLTTGENTYKASSYNMMVVLPDEKQSLQTFVAGLTPEVLSKLQSQMRPQYGEFTMPKFTFSTEMRLNELLDSLGMKRLFTQQAELGGIVQDAQLYISDAQQNTFIKVDEEGTEAAAVTIVTGVAAGATPPLEFKMTADRPFLFLIQDDETGTILFVGTTNQP